MGPRRIHFTPTKDIQLLSEIIAQLPWLEKSKWASVAVSLKKYDEYTELPEVKSLQHRYSLLCQRFKNGNMQNMRKLEGTAEERAEREYLLRSAINLENEHRRRSSQSGPPDPMTFYETDSGNSGRSNQNETNFMESEIHSISPMIVSASSIPLSSYLAHASPGTSRKSNHQAPSSEPRTCLQPALQATSNSNLRHESQRTDLYAQSQTPSPPPLFSFASQQQPSSLPNTHTYTSSFPNTQSYTSSLPNTQSYAPLPPPLASASEPCLGMLLPTKVAPQSSVSSPYPPASSHPTVSAGNASLRPQPTMPFIYAPMEPSSFYSPTSIEEFDDENAILEPVSIDLQGTDMQCAQPGREQLTRSSLRTRMNLMSQEMRLREKEVAVRTRELEVRHAELEILRSDLAMRREQDQRWMNLMTEQMKATRVQMGEMLDRTHDIVRLVLNDNNKQ